MKNAKRMICLCMAVMLMLRMSAWAAPTEETPRNRYEMEIVLNETDRERPRLTMTVKATVVNDSADEWTEVCFRDYMDSVYQRGAGFLYQLEQSMGASFYDFMRAYYAEYAFREVKTEDFLDALAPYIAENKEARALVRKYLSTEAELF